MAANKAGITSMFITGDQTTDMGLWPKTQKIIESREYANTFHLAIVCYHGISVLLSKDEPLMRPALKDIRLLVPSESHRGHKMSTFLTARQ